MKLWTGTSGFQYPEWKGKFYPAGLATSKMLGFYAERFPTTEINYTFRSLPSDKTIARWRDSTPEDFRFGLKAPQSVTHFAKLRDCEEKLATFQQAVSGLGAKLGPVLFQLPPFLKRDDELLREFLDAMPDDLRVAFEFRHDSWFDDETYESLQGANAALCIADTVDLKTPRVVTADFGYLRLRGGDYHPDDIAEWAAFLHKQRKAWPEAFIYFMHEETGSGPVFAQMLMEHAAK